MPLASGPSPRATVTATVSLRQVTPTEVPQLRPRPATTTRLGPQWPGTRREAGSPGAETSAEEQACTSPLVHAAPTSAHSDSVKLATVTILGNLRRIGERSSAPGGGHLQESSAGKGRSRGQFLASSHAERGVCIDACLTQSANYGGLQARWRHTRG